MNPDLAIIFLSNRVLTKYNLIAPQTAGIRLQTARNNNMTFDQKIALIFKDNFNECYRFALNLSTSVRRTETLFPLTAKQMDLLTEDEKERIDAFRVRFCDLQDALGARIFKGLLRLEEESTGSMLDILHSMEKRGILHSFEDWKQLREVRNLFSHESPNSGAARAEALSLAYQYSALLLEILARVKTYVTNQIGLDMSEFKERS